MKNIRKLLTDTCTLFTVLAFLLYGVGKLVVEYTVGLSFENAVLLFITSLMLTLCNRIFLLQRLHIAVRILLHYLAVLGASFLLFAVIGGIVSTSLATLVLLACISIGYSAMALGYALWKTRAPKEEPPAYRSQFKK